MKYVIVVKTPKGEQFDALRNIAHVIAFTFIHHSAVKLQLNAVGFYRLTCHFFISWCHIKRKVACIQS